MSSESTTYADKVVFPLNMGEEAAFEYVFRSYHAPLRYFCGQLTGAGETCEDIVSQLFLVLWTKQVQFQSTEHTQAFLYRSAKNACMNFIRSGKRADKNREVFTMESADMPLDYLNTMIRTEVWAELYRAIAGLPSQICKVITMSYMEGMTNQEIADEMDIAMQTVKNYKIRGLKILKDQLPDELFLLLIALLLK